MDSNCMQRRLGDDNRWSTALGYARNGKLEDWLELDFNRDSELHLEGLQIESRNWNSCGYRVNFVVSRLLVLTPRREKT